MNYDSELEKIAKAKYDTETDRNEAISQFKSNNRKPETEKKSLFSGIKKRKP